MRELAFPSEGELSLCACKTQLRTRLPVGRCPLPACGAGLGGPSRLETVRALRGASPTRLHYRGHITGGRADFHRHVRWRDSNPRTSEQRSLPLRARGYRPLPRRLPKWTWPELNRRPSRSFRPQLRVCTPVSRLGADVRGDRFLRPPSTSATVQAGRAPRSTYRLGSHGTASPVDGWLLTPPVPRAERPTAAPRTRAHHRTSLRSCYPRLKGYPVRARVAPTRRVRSNHPSKPVRPQHRTNKP